MIRETLLWLFISFIAVSAWKDWYKGVCGLIFLMAVLEHPDMPHTIMGLNGLNPWNILLLITLASWFISKKKEDLHWDIPKGVNVLLFLQLAIFILGFTKILLDKSGLEEMRILHDYGLNYETGAGIWSNYFINTIKWVIPGLLLFHGCNSRSRLMLAIFSLLAMYLTLSLLVYKTIPPWKITDVDGLTKYAIKLDRRVGYHRVDLSAMLAGASWAFISTIILVRKNWQKCGIALAGGMVILGQALTGGRTGYIAWLLIGVFFAFFRWKKLLLVIPIIVILVFTLIPQIRDRILVGIKSDQEINYSNPGDEVDVKTLTAGRNGIWRLTFDQFKKAPWLGNGRLAIIRTGVVREAIRELGESFGHPHSAYLEQLVDNGIIGLVIVLLFYLSLVRKSFSLLRDKSNKLYIAIGGITLSLVLSQLIASLTAQSFYPRQGVVGMWCAIGLMLRIYVEREKIMHAEGKQQEVWGK